MTGGDRSHGPTVALAFLVVAAVVLAGSLPRALRVEAVPRTAGSGDGIRVASVPRRVDQPLEPILAAVEKDPFRPERNRPERRFRMPGDAAPPRAAPARPAASVRLVGTLLSPDGGIAMCQVGAQAPKLVRVGETIEGLTLKTVESGQAVFESSKGSRVVIHVAKAGS